MKFTSLAVLALAVASTEAIKLNDPLSEAASEAKKDAELKEMFANMKKE